LTTQRQATGDSPERIQRLALVEAWRNLPDQEKGITAAEAVKMAKKTTTSDKTSPLVYPELASALLELGTKGEIVDSNRLGYILRGIRHTNYGGFKFERCGAKHAKAVLWRVSPV
jgi:hypothetical protein